MGVLRVFYLFWDLCRAGRVGNGFVEVVFVGVWYCVLTLCCKLCVLMCICSIVRVWCVCVMWVVCCIFSWLG